MKSRAYGNDGEYSSGPCLRVLQLFSDVRMLEKTQHPHPMQVMD